MSGPDTENLHGMPGPIEDRTSPFSPEPQAKMPDALTDPDIENLCGPIGAVCEICGSHWEVEYDPEAKRFLCVTDRSQHPRYPNGELRITAVKDKDPSRDKLYTIAVPNVASATQHRIAQECVNIARYLLAKNQQYGSSMMMPGALFSKSTPLERVDVMIDTTLGQVGDEKVVANKRNLIQKLIGWLIIRQLATDNQMGDSKDER